MKKLGFVFSVLPAVVGIVPCCTWGQAIPSLSDIPPSDLLWNNLPAELTNRLVPFIDTNDLHLKVGRTKDDQEYLRVKLRRRGDLSFGVKPVSSETVGFVVMAKRGFYWPDRHLFRLEKEVIVSASTCRLEGEVFDIHLLHDTVRLSGKKMVISLPDGLVPIQSESVRIVGLGGKTAPTFEWDPRRVEAVPTPTPSPSRTYPVELSEGGNISFQGKKCSVEDFKEAVRDLAVKEPDSRFVLYQEPSVGLSIVRQVRRILSESGFDITETITITPKLKQRRLRPEGEEPKFESPNPSVPGHPGARFLWVRGEGKYVLNGREYDDASLRQTLRALVRTNPKVPVVVAAPTGAPGDRLRELVKDLRSFGFHEIQVGVDSRKAGM